MASKTANPDAAFRYTRIIISQVTLKVQNGQLVFRISALLALFPPSFVL